MIAPVSFVIPDDSIIHEAWSWLTGEEQSELVESFEQNAKAVVFELPVEENMLIYQFFSLLAGFEWVLVHFCLKQLNETKPVLPFVEELKFSLKRLFCFLSLMQPIALDSAHNQLQVTELLQSEFALRLQTCRSEIAIQLLMLIREGWIAKLQNLANKQRLLAAWTEFLPPLQSQLCSTKGRPANFELQGGEEFITNLLLFEKELTAYVFIQAHHLIVLLKLFGAQAILELLQDSYDYRSQQEVYITTFSSADDGLAESLARSMSQDLIHYSTLKTAIEMNPFRQILIAYINLKKADESTTNAYYTDLQSEAHEPYRIQFEKLIELGLHADPAFRQYLSQEPLEVNENKFWKKNQAEMFRLLEMARKITKNSLKNTELKAYNSNSISYNNKNAILPLHLNDREKTNTSMAKGAEGSLVLDLWMDGFATKFIAEKLYNFFILWDRTVWLTKNQEDLLNKNKLSIEACLNEASCRLVEKLKFFIPISLDEQKHKVDFFTNKKDQSAKKQNLERHQYFENLTKIDRLLNNTGKAGMTSFYILAMQSCNPELQKDVLEQFFDEGSRLAIYSVILSSKEFRKVLEFYGDDEDREARQNALLALKAKEAINVYEVFYQILLEANDIQSNR